MRPWEGGNGERFAQQQDGYGKARRRMVCRWLPMASPRARDSLHRGPGQRRWAASCSVVQTSADVVVGDDRGLAGPSIGGQTPRDIRRTARQPIFGHPTPCAAPLFVLRCREKSEAAFAVDPPFHSLPSDSRLVPDHPLVRCRGPAAPTTYTPAPHLLCIQPLLVLIPPFLPTHNHHHYNHVAERPLAAA